MVSENSVSTPYQGRQTITLNNGIVIKLNVTQTPVSDPNLPDIAPKNGVLNYASDDGTSFTAREAGGGLQVAGNISLRINTFQRGVFPFLSVFLTGNSQSGQYFYIETETGTAKFGSYTGRSGF